MAYFLTEQLTKSLDEVQTGLSLGKSTINGVVCDHLVLRSETRDGQVWIARGDKPTDRAGGHEMGGRALDDLHVPG